MVSGLFYGSPFRDLRRLQEEMDRLTRSATTPQGFRPSTSMPIRTRS